MAGILSGRYHFAPRPVPTIAAVLFVALTVSLGNWQTRRAAEKLALQQRLEQLATAPAVSLRAARLPSAEALAQHRVTVQGEFVAARTLFIDNRVYRGVPGYQVVTPLRIEAGETYVLVNRGWIAAGPRRERLPEVRTPQGPMVIEGIASVPLAHPYELARDATTGPVRQNLVPERVQSETGLSLQPIVVLQVSAAPDGLVRDWPSPDAGADKNRAYALQWYVMAAIAVALWLGLNLNKSGTPEK